MPRAGWCSATWLRGACSAKAGGWKAALSRTCSLAAIRRCAKPSSAAATACSPSATPTTKTSTTWRGSFRLNGRIHELVLLRQLTAELRRQEVQTWKKVIRVISHELNNSLAPIASLAHSSAELLRRGQTERLPEALSTIEDRARHLEGFIRDYARFAKLPSPRSEPLEWRRFAEQLRTQVEFAMDVQPADGIARFDAAQMEQALLNLLKNAHESGSPAGDVRLSIRRTPEGWRIEVLDRGSGMNEAVLANALLPFYSTKRHGTGLGLALAREIAEAHGGRIALLNRQDGGLCVSMVLPG
jgi:signal transduction histidine kinase